MAISQILSASLASGVPASSNMPTGSVLQVVSSSYTTSMNTTSSSFVTTGFSASITPKFATSKIFAIAMTSAECAGSGQTLLFTLYRGSTNISPNTNNGLATLRNGVGNYIDSTPTIMVLDSPATTSSTTYSLYVAVNNGGTGYFGNINGTATTITLMEIAG